MDKDFLKKRRGSRQPDESDWINTFLGDVDKVAQQIEKKRSEERRVGKEC